MIDLLLLGTSGMMPLPGRWLSSLLVRSGGDLILFDSGEGTQIPMQQSGWGFRRVGVICLSHWHADHVAGLPGLLHTIANSGRTEPMRIYGPIGTADVVHGLRVIAPQLPYPIEVAELTGGERFDLTGALSASVIPGAHRVPSLIYRVDLPRAPQFLVERAEALGVPRERWSHLQAGGSVELNGRTIQSAEVMGPPRIGVSLGFMTDTRPVPGVAEFFAGVDLIVSEGTYGDSAMRDKAITNKHMTFAEAAEIARDAGAGRLWLTHFSPSIADPDEFKPFATAIFPATEIGYSGLTASLRFRD
jgi:ribonuclease Z